MTPQRRRRALSLEQLVRDQPGQPQPAVPLAARTTAAAHLELVDPAGQIA